MANPYASLVGPICGALFYVGLLGASDLAFTWRGLGGFALMGRAVWWVVCKAVEIGVRAAE